MSNVKSTGSSISHTWLWILPWPFASYGTLSKSVNLSRYRFPHQKTEHLSIELFYGWMRMYEKDNAQHIIRVQEIFATTSSSISFSGIKIWPSKREKLVPRGMTSQDVVKSCGVGPPKHKPDSYCSIYNWDLCSEHSSIGRQPQYRLIHIWDTFEMNSGT